MAYNKRTWLGRQGTGLNKFSIGGATPVTIVNQPDSVTQVGDALSAGNLNDLEDRIESAFDDVDTALDTKADEQDVTNLNNAIAQHEARIENLEQKAGDYSTVQYRGTNAVPTGKAKYAMVESIVGKTRAWNQICPKFSERTTVIDGVTWTIDSDGVVTASWSSTLASNSTFSIFGSTDTWGASIPQGHKFLIGNKSASTATQIRFAFYDSNNTSLYDTGLTSANSADIYTMPNGTAVKMYYALRIVSGTPAGSAVFYPIIRDLTLIFPEGVPSTIAECVQKCPDILKYDSYGYSLVSTTVSGVKSIGVNLWDEEWEVGNIQAGSPVPSTQYFRSKNFIRVEPSKSYYLYSGTNDNIYVFEYRMDLAYANVVTIIDSANHVFTPSANTWYVRFADRSRVAYGNDIQIVPNSLPDSVKQTYHPHTEFTLSLSTPVALKSAGSVSEVLDVETGYKTRPLGSYTFDGTEGFVYAGGVRFVWEGFNPGRGAKIPPDNNTLANICLGGYVAVSSANTELANYDKVVGLSRYGALCIRDTAYNGDTIAQFKASLVGKTIYFERSTPDTDESVCDPVINNTLPTEGGGTIETIQTQTPVIDNSLDVGYLAI